MIRGAHLLASFVSLRPLRPRRCGAPVGDAMSRILVTLVFAFAPSLVCLGAAAAMALNGVGGWGWFLFAGLLLGGSVSVKGIPNK